VNFHDSHSLMELASAQARHAFGVCEDLAAAIFPRGDCWPTEQLQAAAGAKLHDLVCSVECALEIQGHNGYAAKTWPLLAENGALRTAPFSAFALARVTEDRIFQRMNAENRAASLNFLSSRLLESDNSTLADLARQLLIAEQCRNAPRKSLYTQLEPQLLRQLIALIADASDTMSGDKAASERASSLLSRHNVSTHIAVSAQKLLFALGDRYQDALGDPIKAGPHLYVAGLALEFGLSHDTVLRMIGSGSVAPLALLLGLRHLDQATTVTILKILRGQDKDIAELGTIEGAFGGTSDPRSIEVVAEWRKAEGRLYEQ
jgi:hypothetical protein